MEDIFLISCNMNTWACLFELKSVIILNSYIALFLYIIASNVWAQFWQPN